MCGAIKIAKDKKNNMQEQRGQLPVSRTVHPLGYPPGHDSIIIAEVNDMHGDMSVTSLIRLRTNINFASVLIRSRRLRRRSNCLSIDMASFAGAA